MRTRKFKVIVQSSAWNGEIGTEISRKFVSGYGWMVLLKFDSIPDGVDTRFGDQFQFGRHELEAMDEEDIDASIMVD